MATSDAVQILGGCSVDDALRSPPLAARVARIRAVQSVAARLLPALVAYLEAYADPAWQKVGVCEQIDALLQRVARDAAPDTDAKARAVARRTQATIDRFVAKYRDP